MLEWGCGRYVDLKRLAEDRSLLKATEHKFSDWTLKRRMRFVYMLMHNLQISICRCDILLQLSSTDDDWLLCYWKSATHYSVPFVSNLWSQFALLCTSYHSYQGMSINLCMNIHLASTNKLNCSSLECIPRFYTIHSNRSNTSFDKSCNILKLWM